MNLEEIYQTAANEHSKGEWKQWSETPTDKLHTLPYLKDSRNEEQRAHSAGLEAVAKAARAEVATPDDVRDAKRYRDRREKAFREAIGVAEGLLTPEAVAQADREKWLKRYDIASDFLPPLLRPV